jgi:hypothetical protein
MEARLRLKVNHSGAVVALDAQAPNAVSMRCSIHGLEMDYIKGNTYFCPACLGLTDKKSPRFGNGRGHKKDAR